MHEIGKPLQQANFRGMITTAKAMPLGASPLLWGGLLKFAYNYIFRIV
ncbi:MAG: hypothetical protein ACI3YH_07875 [Eubacteriales bacterium]